MPVAPARVAALARRFPHHSAYSGYWQIVRRMDAVEVLGGRPRGLSERLSAALIRRTGRIAYTDVSLSLELAAGVRMLWRPRTLCHVLYGEDDYHYLAVAAPLVRRAGGRLLASFHQPPEIFDVAVPPEHAQRILPQLDAAVVTTGEQRRHLSRWMAPSRIHHVPHGVDTSFFAPAERSRERKRRVITVGVWQRDFALLEQVVELCAARDDGLRFTVISTPEVARRLADRPNVDAYAGIPDSELRDLYRSSDLLFLPLVQAAANNTLLEAMACGLAVVATDLPGVREYAGSGCARFVPRFEPAAAAAEIARLAADDAELERLGRRARERAITFDWEASAAALTAVYELVAAGSPR